MLRRRLIPGSAVAALSVLLLAASAAAQPAALAEFEESVGKAVQDWRVPSLAVAGVHDGRVVVNKGYGTCRA
jgi:CubicO group peptidase (beta-lactamase class C family)